MCCVGAELLVLIDFAAVKFESFLPGLYFLYLSFALLFVGTFVVGGLELMQ